MKKKIIIDGKETRYSVTDDGRVFNDETGRELKGTTKTNEYQSIILIIDGKERTFLVHRLVAQAFCENPDPETHILVDHINGNKHDNRAENLHWVNNSMNMKNIKNRTKPKKTKYYNDDFDENWIEVYNNPNYMINKDGVVVKSFDRRILSQEDRNGYKRVLLNGSKKSVHILVWESFNDAKVPEGYYIDHIDGERGNNNLNNLRLVTQSENMKNSYRNGHAGQVRVKQYDLKGNFIKEYNNIQEAADEVGVTQAAVKSAANRHGTCKDFYWVREDDDATIEQILVEWIPDGFVVIPEFPTYAINKKGEVYNKRNKKTLNWKQQKEGTVHYVNIGGTKRSINRLLNDVGFNGIE